MTRTKAEVRAFLDSKVGHTCVDQSNRALDGQCVCLIKNLMDFLGVGNPYAGRGNAKDAGDNYVKQGIASYGRGWLTVCVNKSMGYIGGEYYGHIWIDLLNETNYESNGARALVTTKGTRPIEQAGQFINFDKWIAEKQEVKGDEPVVENNAAHKGRVGRIFKQTRGRYMSDEEFPQFVGLTYLRVNEVLGDNQEAFDNERRAELGYIAGRDNWAGQIADRTAERDWANAEKETAQKEKEAALARAMTADKENKELREQLANQSDDTKLLNGFGEFLNKLIARLGVKKEK